MCHVKNKEPIHGSGRYCLPIRYINVSEPLEWSVYIENWPCANFFMGWTCFVRECPKIKICWCVRLQPMSWTTNLVPKVTKHSNEVYLCVGCDFIPPFCVVHEEKEYFHTWFCTRQSLLKQLYVLGLGKESNKQQFMLAIPDHTAFYPCNAVKNNVAVRVNHWTTKWNSFSYKHVCIGIWCLRPTKQLAGLGKEFNKKYPWWEGSCHTAF